MGDDPAAGRGGRRDREQRRWHDELGIPLLVACASRDASSERVVVADDDWLTLVPFWAVWPFEVLLLPRRQVRRRTAPTDGERSSLAAILQRLLEHHLVSEST